MSQPNGIDVTCMPTDGSLTCLTRGASVGLTMKVAASLLSSGSLLYTFLFIAYANRHTFRTGIQIFYTDMDILIFSLLGADFVQAIGGLLNVKWILDGIVEAGPLCDAQGTLKVFGETATAMFTLLVAIYTFVVISTGRGFATMRTTVAIVVGIWVLIAILVGVGHASNHDPSKVRYISPTPYWCWVGKDYVAWRIGSECFWLWTTLFVSPLLYIPLYLWIRGNLVFRESVWYKWSFQSRKFSDPNLRSIRRAAWIMLLYPAVTYVCIVPLSVVRWISFLQGTSTMPTTASFVVSTIFNLSGFFNVILVFTTKPKLGLFGQQKQTCLGRVPSLPSFRRSRPESEPEVVMKRIP